MPRVVTGLVGAIVLAHIATLFVSPEARKSLILAYGVTPAAILGEAGSNPIAAAAPFITHIFLHAGWIHLFFNSFLILQTGELVAERFGRDARGVGKFLLLFLGAGVLAAATYIGLNSTSPMPAIGASGAACGLYAAYLLALAPDWRIAIRAPQVWQMAFYFLAVNVGLAMLARTSGVFPIAWEAHLGGFVGGVLLYPLLAPRRWRHAPWG